MYSLANASAVPFHRAVLYSDLALADALALASLVLRLLLLSLDAVRTEKDSTNIYKTAAVFNVACGC